MSDQLYVPGRFTLGNHCVEGWKGTGNGQDAEVKRTPCSAGYRSPVTVRYPATVEFRWTFSPCRHLFKH